MYLDCCKVIVVFSCNIYPHQLCASFSCFSLFPTISIDDMGATSGVIFLFLACFQMGFYFMTTGWIIEIGVCVNSINQSIKVYISGRITRKLYVVF